MLCEIREEKMLRTLTTIAWLLLASVAPAAPEVDFKDCGNWPATVDEIKKFLQLAPGWRPTNEETNLQFSLLRRISRLYPLEFDWVEQDLHDNPGHMRDFYFRRTPEMERKMLEKVFADLGRDCPEVSRGDFLWTYHKAAAGRRQRRLAGLKDHCRKIVFVKHFNLGGSHYAYTEALSDAQGQRFFVPGGALCVYDVKTGKVETLLAAYSKWWDKVRPLLVNEDAPLDTGKPFITQFRRQEKERGISDWVPPET